MQPELAEFNKNRFLIGMLLNSIFVAVEIYYGFVANSIALIADGVHKASDVLGLGLSWLSYYLAQRQTSVKFTYGFKNATIFAAFLNSLILMIAIANLIYESVLRLAHPQPVGSLIVICVAAFGVVINAVSATLFYADKKNDLNIKGAFLNMALDTLLSFAVVVGGLIIWFKGWVLIDPSLGLLIGVTIIYSIWHLFKDSLHLVLQAVPYNIDLHAVIHDIEQMPEIIEYHDLHIWAMSTTETALSVHIVTADSNFNPLIVAKLAALFREKYNILHSTIQLESVNSKEPCILRC